MLPIQCFTKNAASSTERLAIVILSTNDDLTYVYAVDNRFAPNVEEKKWRKTSRTEMIKWGAERGRKERIWGRIGNDPDIENEDKVKRKKQGKRRKRRRTKRKKSSCFTAGRSFFFFVVYLPLLPFINVWCIGLFLATSNLILADNAPCPSFSPSSKSSSSSDSPFPLSISQSWSVICPFVR